MKEELIKLITLKGKCTGLDIFKEFDIAFKEMDIDHQKIIFVTTDGTPSIVDRHPIHRQLVPAHLGLLGNELADDLAKAAASDLVNPEDHMVLTSTEIYCKAKELIGRTWVVPSVHPCFQICTCEALKCPQHIENGCTYQAFYPGMARIKDLTRIAGGL
ncbi:RNase H domain-containing protein [Trichonephila clavipes]|nr:RNase H domain-containing protein [Trichonephila clavipes]